MPNMLDLRRYWIICLNQAKDYDYCIKGLKIYIETTQFESNFDENLISCHQNSELVHKYHKKYTAYYIQKIISHHLFLLRFNDCSFLQYRFSEIYCRCKLVDFSRANFLKFCLTITRNFRVICVFRWSSQIQIQIYLWGLWRWFKYYRIEIA